MRFVDLLAPIAIVGLLLTALIAKPADSGEIRVAELVRDVCSRTKSAEDKKRAEEQLKEEDVALVLPAILAEREHLVLQVDDLFSAYGLGEEKLSDGARAMRALDRIWDNFIFKKENAGKTLAPNEFFAV